ncbi:hypothetical protein MAR_013922 [Mya arenaria]|uniref:Uncharacterized protein n=1 Tax=Mya arenaria TaxID=6604 RepID=A0ABY7G176_MYAAR|nr:hypothetical protein MAR_013922 [Mya arenaria]
MPHITRTQAADGDTKGCPILQGRGLLTGRHKDAPYYKDAGGRSDNEGKSALGHERGKKRKDKDDTIKDGGGSTKTEHHRGRNN